MISKVSFFIIFAIFYTFLSGCGSSDNEIDKEPGKIKGFIYSVSTVKDLRGYIAELEEKISIVTGERDQLKKQLDRKTSDVDRHEQRLARMLSVSNPDKPIGAESQ